MGVHAAWGEGSWSGCHERHRAAERIPRTGCVEGILPATIILGRVIVGRVIAGRVIPTLVASRRRSLADRRARRRTAVARRLAGKRFRRSPVQTGVAAARACSRAGLRRRGGRWSASRRSGRPTTIDIQSRLLCRRLGGLRGLLPCASGRGGIVRRLAAKEYLRFGLGRSRRGVGRLACRLGFRIAGRRIERVDQFPNFLLGAEIGSLHGVPGLVGFGVRTLPAEASRLLWFLGNHRVVPLESGRWRDDDLRRCPLGGIVQENLGGLESPLAGPEFPGIDDLPGIDGHTISNHAGLGVRGFALDFDVDLARSDLRALLDAVDQVDQSRLVFQEADLGIDLGENVPLAAVDVLHGGFVKQVLGLDIRFARPQLEIPSEFRRAELLVAHQPHIADLIAEPFIDHESDRNPILLFTRLQDSADRDVEEAQVMVIGSEAFDVFFEFFSVEITFDVPEPARLGLHLGYQPFPAGDRVADEVRPEDPLLGPLVDHKNSPRVVRPVPLRDFDVNLAESLGMVVFDQLPPAFLDGVGVHRLAGLQSRLLGQRLLTDIFVAHEFDVLKDRLFQYVENNPLAAGHILDDGRNLDEFPRLVQPANVLVDHPRIERPACPAVDLRDDLLVGNEVISADAQIDNERWRRLFRDAAAVDQRSTQDRQDDVERQPNATGSRARIKSHSGHPWPFPSVD